LRQGGDNPRLTALARFARDQGVERVEWCSRSELDRLAAAASHQGAAAWAPELHPLSMDELLGREWRLAVALDGIQDPHNFGACIRAAVAIADAPIVWAEHASAPLSPATFRASAGAIEHALLCQVPSLPSALGAFRAAGAEVLGLTAEATLELGAAVTHTRTVVVVGGEHQGLRRSVRRGCTALVRLAEMHHVQALNASVAAGIALYACAQAQREAELTRR
jgi:23S rRNA (guanosine2251-2'-O)-methyltransferase